jgi:hypothetical protein
MADTLRSRTIRLAHSLPAGSPERRALIEALDKTAFVPPGGPPVDVERALRSVYGVIGDMKAEAKRNKDDRLDYWADKVSDAMLKIWRKRL